ncbi:hypothetical protein V6N11_084223 [Hibiscus sabdariffa]|uniref:Uncharacterized protein n=1 Tax=Hibiscus sabdariffa TaxID=183260 RepID=A0ABR2QS95_9ROSI
MARVEKEKDGLEESLGKGRPARLEAENLLEDFDDLCYCWSIVEGINFDLYNPCGVSYETAREGLLPYVRIEVGNDPFTPIDGV